MADRTRRDEVLRLMEIAGGVEGGEAYLRERLFEAGAARGYTDSTYVGFPNTPAAREVGQAWAAGERDEVMGLVNAGQFGAANRVLGKMKHGRAHTPEGYAAEARQISADAYAVARVLQDFGAIQPDAPIHWQEGGDAAYATLTNQTQALSFAAVAPDNAESAVAAIEGLGGTLRPEWSEADREFRAVVGVPDKWRDEKGDLNPARLKDSLLHLNSVFVKNGQDWAGLQNRLAFRIGEGEMSFSDVVQEAGMEKFFQRGVGASGWRDKERVASAVLGIPGLWNSDSFRQGFQQDIVAGLEEKYPARRPIFRRAKNGELIETAADARALILRGKVEELVGIEERADRKLVGDGFRRFGDIEEEFEDPFHAVVVDGAVREFDGVREAYTSETAFQGEKLRGVQGRVEKNACQRGLPFARAWTGQIRRALPRRPVGGKRGGV